MNSINTNAVILAGGRSSRMGTDKALLKNHNDTTLLDAAIETLQTLGVDNILVSRNSSEYRGGLKDIFIDSGPVAGIHSALHHYPNSHLLVLPVDMPLVTISMLDSLIKEGLKCSCSVMFQFQCMPLFISWKNGLTEQVADLLREDKPPSVKRLCRMLEAKSIVCQNPQNLINANDPEQWQECLDQLVQ